VRAAEHLEILKKTLTFRILPPSILLIDATDFSHVGRISFPLKNPSRSSAPWRPELRRQSWYFCESPKNTKIGYQPSQPVAFSHKLHAGQLADGLPLLSQLRGGGGAFQRPDLAGVA
jgi:hypothetical protein